MTKNIILSKVKGPKTHFSKLRDQKYTFSKVKGPKTHFLKLRDQNMTFTNVKGPKTYFSLLFIFLISLKKNFLIHFLFILFMFQNIYIN